MQDSQTSTMRTQELIYKRRIHRMQVTKGVRRGKLIDRVNVVSKDKKRIARKRKEEGKERT